MTAIVQNNIFRATEAGTYQVKATVAGGKCPDDFEQIFSIQVIDRREPDQWDAPVLTSLTAGTTSATNREITARWDAGVDATNITRYRAQRSTSNTFPSATTAERGGLTGLSVIFEPNVNPQVVVGTKQYVRVRAFDTGNTKTASEWSNIMEITPTTTSLTKLATPTPFNFRQDTNSSVIAFWNNQITGAASYNFRWRVNNGSWQGTTTTIGNSHRIDRLSIGDIVEGTIQALAPTNSTTVSNSDLGTDEITVRNLDITGKTYYLQVVIAGSGTSVCSNPVVIPDIMWTNSYQWHFAVSGATGNIITSLNYNGTTMKSALQGLSVGTHYMPITVTLSNQPSTGQQPVKVAVSVTPNLVQRGNIGVHLSETCIR